MALAVLAICAALAACGENREAVILGKWDCAIAEMKKGSFAGTFDFAAGGSYTGSQTVGTQQFGRPWVHRYALTGTWKIRLTYLELRFEETQTSVDVDGHLAPPNFQPKPTDVAKPGRSDFRIDTLTANELSWRTKAGPMICKR